MVGWRGLRAALSLPSTLTETQQIVVGRRGLGPLVPPYPSHKNARSSRMKEYTTALC